MLVFCVLKKAVAPMVYNVSLETLTLILSSAYEEAEAHRGLIYFRSLIQSKNLNPELPASCLLRLHELL